MAHGAVASATSIHSVDIICARPGMGRHKRSTQSSSMQIRGDICSGWNAEGLRNDLQTCYTAWPEAVGSATLRSMLPSIYLSSPNMCLERCTEQKDFASERRDASAADNAACGTRGNGLAATQLLVDNAITSGCRSTENRTPQISGAAAITFCFARSATEISSQTRKSSTIVACTSTLRPAGR